MQIIKSLSVFLFALLAISAAPAFVGVQNNDEDLLKEIRQNLKHAVESEKVCEELYAKVKDLQNPKPLLKGYIGALTITRSKHVSIFDKLSTFHKGRDILDEAVKAAPNETELHFLRLTLQLNLPGFLGYKHHIAEDKEFVLANYPTSPKVLKEKISDFVNTSGHFTEKEKQRVKM